MSDDTQKEPVETLEEAARRLIGVMDERQRNRPAAANAAKIEPASAPNGLAGEVYPCKPEIFAATYDPA